MKYHKDVLKNGLRLITVPMKESQSAIAMVLVEAGSEYETRQINGLSHFLEHMCFKGTTNRTGNQINLELDGLGAETNAFTSNQLTGYWAKARYKKVDKILDIVSDLYLNPTFPEKDIDIERGVIIEEINMYEDLPMRKVWDVWMELLYGNKQPSGWTIIGPKENIRTLKRDDFVKYHNEHYIPQKTTVVVAGNIDRKKILKQINDTFGQIEKGKVIKKVPVKESQKTPQIKLLEKKSDQSHLIVGFRAFDMYDKRNTALKVATTILGGSMSSRLFKKMRDELGMCYYVRAEKDMMTDKGMFVVSAGVGNDRTEEAVSVIMDEYRKMRDEEIPADEIKKAKDIILGHMATGHETSDSWAHFYGGQELFHEKIETPSEIEKKIRAVTEKDIKKVLKQIFTNDRLNLAIIGPHKNPAKFKKLLKI
jgi:predicted Zn-dependent peptidase